MPDMQTHHTNFGGLWWIEPVRCQAASYIDNVFLSDLDQGYNIDQDFTSGRLS